MNAVSKLNYLHETCVDFFRESNCIGIDDIISNDKGLHISLSKHFTLRHHLINAFIDKLGEELLCVFKNRFFLEVYSEYYILNNETMTRSFVCLPVEDRSDMLIKLVRVVDSIMKSFKRPEYYHVPKFHLSIASLAYRESLQTEAIIDVPIVVERTEAALLSDTSAVTDIYQYSSKYCVSDSSEDEAQPDSKPLPNQTIRVDGSALIDVSMKSPVNTIGVVSTKSAVSTGSTESTLKSVNRGHETLICDSIECSIGNRLFRLSVCNDINSKMEFKEISQFVPASNTKRKKEF